MKRFSLRWAGLVLSTYMESKEDGLEGFEDARGAWLLHRALGRDPSTQIHARACRPQNGTCLEIGSLISDPEVILLD